MKNSFESHRLLIALVLAAAILPGGCAYRADHQTQAIESTALIQAPLYSTAQHEILAGPQVAPPAPARQAVLTHPVAPTEPLPSVAAQARQRLIAGNQRFVGEAFASNALGRSRRLELVKGEKPFAAILCCSDSRVPPELVFDQGLGDIFIIRVAGNVADPDVTASVEYAVEHLHVPLVVVLGHEQCGVVKAALQGGEAHGSIGTLLAKIKPAVARARAAGLQPPEAILDRAIDENVNHWVADLKHSPVVHEPLEQGKLAVLGAKYHLSTGEVGWYY